MNGELVLGDGSRCVCGRKANGGSVAVFGTVRVCLSGDHVLVGPSQNPRVYIHVENPSDVIEVSARCWLCGGVEPNETVTVAREFPNGPKCTAYKTMVHTGCWQDMAP